MLDFANDADDILAAFQPFFETAWSEPTDPNVLFNLRGRIMLHAVIDPADMHDAVEALLSQGEKANAVLIAATDAAATRSWNITDPDDQEDFRTALRDFVRTYAFLGQVVPFASGDLEELFYFGKYLATRIKPETDDGGLDLGDAAILTHIRTQLLADDDITLIAGADEGLPGMHDGRGAQHTPDKVRLSSLIDLLNERFGLDLGEADQVWVDQQITAAVQDTELQHFARSNSEENFGYVFDDKFTDVVIDRQEANGELFNLFFGKPEFQQALTDWARREVYRRIQEGGDAA